MTPKQKAQELVNRFQELNRSKISDYSRIEFPTAKQCALIVIDEILDLLSRSLNPPINYWQEVKQEIEKL